MWIRENLIKFLKRSGTDCGYRVPPQCDCWA